MATKKKRNAASGQAPADRPRRPLAAVVGYGNACTQRPEGELLRQARPAIRAPKPPTLSLPVEIVRGDWTVIILALMMFLAPAVGRAPRGDAAGHAEVDRGVVRGRWARA
jgi:hypothetical protein